MYKPLAQRTPLGWSATAIGAAAGAEVAATVPVRGTGRQPWHAGARARAVLWSMALSPTTSTADWLIWRRPLRLRARGVVEP